jgi:TATA-binding protein-associated factor
MSRLLQLCVKRSKEGRGGNPADKVIKNICSFLCADTAHTPVLQNDRRTSGIISLDTVATVEPPAKRGRRSRVPIIMPTDETPEAREVRLIRRGAEMAIREIAQLFGPHLFDELPKLWECASTKIIAAFPEGE